MCCLSCSTEVNDAPAERLALQDGEPALDLIEPRGACRRKVECHERVALEPFVVLLVCIQIVEDDLEPCLWIGGNDVIHEVEKFLAATAFLVCGPDLAGGNLEGGKQGCRAMPFVVVAVPGQGASVRQFQVALRPFKGLDRRLLIDAENNRVLGRRQIETDHIGGLCRKIRIVALAPAFAPARSIFCLRSDRQTYCTSTSPNARAINGPFQRANPLGGGWSRTLRMRWSVASP